MTGFKSLFSFGNSSSEQAHDDQFNYSTNVVQTKWVQDEQNYYFKVALPGLTDKDILIKLDDSNGDTANPLLIIQAGSDIQSRIQQLENENNARFNNSYRSNNSTSNQGQQVGYNSARSVTPTLVGSETIGYANLNLSSPVLFNQPSQSVNRGILFGNNHQSEDNQSQLFKSLSLTNLYRTYFPVPTSRIKTDGILASVEHGVLTVKLPKVHQGYGVQGTRPVQLIKSSRL